MGVKTNNSFLKNKVDLRIRNMPENPYVLDCFGGSGLIWRHIQKETGTDIKYLSIDKIDYGIGFFLQGDNMKYLEKINLEDFNVIDVDAYGVPFGQIEILFRRGYMGIVFFTFIQSVSGQIPDALLVENGFTKQMIDTCPIFLSRCGWVYFKNWLAKKGVRTLTHRSHHRKHYGMFRIE